MANVGEITAKLGLDNKDFKKGLKDSKGEADKFSSGFKKAGAALIAFLAVDKVAAFTKEIFLLRETFDGVNKAFNKLPNSTKLMSDLKRSTGDTVSELNLMKAAVQAQNFNIPLGKMAGFFEFATKRAAETGESVDYLVQSIITGIGRKSPLILDNLGISASELSDEFKRVGDFGEAAGNIIEKSLGSSTLTVDEAAKSSAQLGTAWENFKVTLGGFVQTEGKGLLNWLTESVNGVNTLLKEFGGGAVTGSIEQQISKVNTKLNELNGLLSAAYDSGRTQDIKGIKSAIEKWKDELIRLNKEYYNLNDSGTTQGLEKQVGLIQKLQDDIKHYGELLTSATNTTDIASYNIKIKELKKELEDLMKLGTGSILPNISAPEVSGMGIDPKTFEMMAPVLPILQGVNFEMEKMPHLFTNAIGGINAMGDAFLSVGSIMRDFAGGVLVGFAEDIGNAISGVGKFGDNMIAAVGSFMKAFGKQLIQIGLQKAIADKFILVPGAGPAIAAAGIALIAASTAIGNVGGGGISGGGSSGGGGSSISASSGFAGLSSSMDKAPIDINITGQMDGRVIKFVLDKANRNTGITG